jgi:hypothetical protein
MMNSEAIKPTVYFLSFVGSRYSRSSTILNSKSKSVNRKYLQLDSGVKGITRSILKKRLELREADAIVVMSPCQMIAPLVRILLRKTVILDAGWPLTDGVLSRGVKLSNLHRLASIFFVDFLAFHTSNLVLLESEAQLKRCRRIFLLSNRKCSVQYTGLDESKFNVLESKSQLVQDLEVKISSINNPLTVIFRGKVNKESGFTKILETAAKMPKEATFLFLLGLEDQYSNAPDNVLIAKGFTDSEMRYLYEISDIAIGQISNHPRLRYTIPHKAYEAAFFAKCYITLDTPSVREIFNKESVFFLDQTQPDSLKSAIKSLEDIEIRLSHSQRIRAEYEEKISQCLISRSFDQQVIEILRHQFK